MIRVLVPDMPTAEELLPYLRRMDRSKIYVNAGPMVRELEIGLAEMLKVERVAVTSNGTTALEIALRAMDIPEGSYVAVPAATFVATGLAVVNAGLIPILVDTHGDSDWQLTPGHVRPILSMFGKTIQAVVPVATFGAPVDASAWAAFADSTNTTVVIDAAGALTTQVVPQSPRCAVAFSMHATKFVPAGEGGVVASVDPDVVEHVERLASFGHGGTNARMSEYHAAVGLVSLEKIPARRLRTQAIAESYEAFLPEWVRVLPIRDRTLMPVVLPEANHTGLPRFMEDRGVEVRQWYRPFLNERPQFFSSTYKGVDDLRQRVFGLPFHRFMPRADVFRVAEVLKEYERSFH